MTPTPSVRAALRTMLSGDLATQEHAAGIAADLLVALRREGLLISRQESLYQTVLEAYIAHRSTKNATDMLLDLLQWRLLLEPLAVEDFKRFIEAWSRTQIQAVSRSGQEEGPLERPDDTVIALFSNPIWRAHMENQIEEMRE